MSRRREPPRGTGLRLLAGGALLLVALVTVLARGQVTAERYALADAGAQLEDARRRTAAARCALSAALQELARTADPGEETH